MLNQQCPLPDVLTDIDEVMCPEQFGQIQKLAIRMIQPAGDTGFTDVADVMNKAKWSVARTATDETKIILTPSIPGIVIPHSEVLTEEGNNNNTLNGIPTLVGKSTIKVTGKCLNMPVAIAKQLEAITMFSNVSGSTLIEAFFINESGQIIYKTGLGGDIVGFPIYNFVISSVGSEGFKKPNTHVVSFEMDGSWDDGLAICSPMKSGMPTPWDPRKV